MGDAAIKKDVNLSAILGPARFLVPIIGYAIIYPLILVKYGAEVLGLWALLSAIPNAMSVLDIGFSQLIIRDVAQMRAAHSRDVVEKYLVAKKFYLFCGAFGSIVVFPLVYFFVQKHPTPYDNFALAGSVSVMILAVAVQLLAKLEAAVLSGENQNYFVQIAMGGTPIVLFFLAISGAVSGRPIEGLVAGVLISQICLLCILKRRQARLFSTMWGIDGKLISETQLGILKKLIREGWLLYSMSIGLLIREPMLRMTIAIVLGLKASAIFEIAMRLARLPRDIFSTGFLSLYASFTILLKEEKHIQLINLARRSLLILLASGGASLGLLGASLPWILRIWLKDFDNSIIEGTRILIVWCAITLLNVPFWYMLLAARKEHWSAISVWAHVVLIGALYPLSFLFPLDLASALKYWTITSLLTQGLIYSSVHYGMKLLVPIMSSIPVIVGIVLTATMFWIQLSVIKESSTLPIFSVIVALIFIILIIWCLIKQSQSQVGKEPAVLSTYDK